MKLYHFDHCPYCVRVRLALALLDYQYESVVLLNDDETTPIALVGKKVVPILQLDDGTAMPESLDIVAYLNQQAQSALVMEARPEVQAWLSQTEVPYRNLIHPRNTKLPLPEFATASARAYYDAKKSASIGDFAEHLANSARYIAELEHAFQQLEALCRGEVFFNEQASLEDILLFPVLRNLTAVAGLRYPARLERYVNELSARANIATYHQYAC